jgi:hypothetical protein
VGEIINLHKFEIDRKVISQAADQQKLLKNLVQEKLMYKGIID